MITNIELTDAGSSRMNNWLGEVGKPGLDLQRVAFDLLEILADRAALGESLHVELGQQYTNSGRPETITFAAAEIEITEENEE